MDYLRLDEMCDLNMGQSPSSESYNQEEEGIPFFQGNADFGEIYPITRVWCDKPTKVVGRGTLLISVRAPIGALNFATEKSCIGRGLAGLTAKNGYDLKYIYFALKYKEQELNNKGTGSTFKAISKSSLGEVLIRNIAIEKQKECVKKLDLLQKMIIDEREQIERLDTLIKSRFVEMFGDAIHNAKGWQTDTVDKLCREIYGGGTPSKSHPEYYEDGDIPWVSSKDMKTDVLMDSQIKINQLGVDNSTARIVPVNSVIMVIRSGILKHTLPVAINAVPITVNQDLKVFIPSERILTRFLAVQFMMHEKDILTGVRAVTADNIEFNSLKQRKLIAPPIELQKEYVSFVNQIDKLKVMG